MSFVAGADGVDDVKALTPVPDELFNEFRGVLEVSVQRDDGVTRGVGDAGDEGFLVSEISREGDVADSLVHRGCLA